ncbi:MAG: serine--tRNA ligase [Opitutales bacterium]|nr:serine--tRNA ligase [Opitutales bacterium]
MIDLKLLREQPELVKQGVAKKKFPCDIDAFLALDRQRRDIVTEAEQARAGQKAANNLMSELPKGSAEFKAKVAELKELSAKVKELVAKQDEVDAEWKKAYLTIPNIPAPEVPIGQTDDDNVCLSVWGDPDRAYANATPHWELPWFEKYIDLARGTKITGAGFPVFMGDMARFVRALIQFFLEEDTAAGYVEVSPPIVVNPQSATAVGQLPDKEGQMYYMPVDDFYLIPTAETSVTNLYRDEVLESLPVYHCAYTPCFRREAGSYGKDVRGMNRVHQFDKVELLKWVKPGTGEDELKSLVEHACGMLKKLGLTHRQMLMATHDLGPPHAKKIDLEVWSAGQKRWLEVSSCSLFTDFQARRANIRFRDADGKLQFVHTLNGSGLAVPRVLAALLENNIQDDGTVLVPECLRRWMGKDRLGDQRS